MGFMGGLVVAIPVSVVLLFAGCAGEAQREELPIQNDMSGDCGWPEATDQDLSLSCEDGHYRVFLGSVERTSKHIVEKHFKSPVESVAVEVDSILRRLPNAGGVLAGVGCVASGPEEPIQGYVFFLGAEGERSGFAIVKVDETDDTLEQQGFLEVLTEGTSDAVEGVLGNNHVRGECRVTDSGVDLLVLLDGDQLARATDQDGFAPYDGAGLLVQATSAGTEIWFDNFRAEEIGRTESG
jgi:hypothetical protein